MAEHTPDAVGGICDGGLVAALVASRRRPPAERMDGIVGSSPPAHLTARHRIAHHRIATAVPTFLRASLRPAGVRLLLNLCGTPWRRLPPELRPADAPMVGPMRSLHLLGANDEALEL